jgi:ornithine decarboxylase
VSHTRHRGSRRQPRIRYWINRYLPSELTGTALSLVTAWATFTLTDSLLAAAVAGTIGESIGFYGVSIARSFVEQWREIDSGHPARTRVSLVRTAWLTVVEFGPAEIIDTVLVRPTLMYAGPVVLGIPLAGWIAGKLSADVVFYVVAACSITLGRRWRAVRAARTRDDTVLTAAVRERRIASMIANVDLEELDRAIALYGTPLLLIDPTRVVAQFEQLTSALPFVRFHYALKGFAHPAVVEAIAPLGGNFDVASDAEIDLLSRLGIHPSRVIHTQPVKSLAEIARSYRVGIRTFVIDSAGELAKFLDLPGDVEVLIRLSYRNSTAKSDLSSKFGVGPHEADALLAQAIAQGTRVAGFSFHVGSQLDDVAPFRVAVAATLALMDRLERRHGVRFDILDIGGGFPASYRRDSVTIDEIAAAIRPLLEPIADRVRIIAEPGRALVADAGIVATRVVGTRVRDGENWAFIDDGVYGSYSNVMTEAVHPVIVARGELSADSEAPPRPLSPTTIAGPTCDSADIVARHYPMPPVHDGDVLLSPTMGAYTTVTASEFNGRPKAAIVVLTSAASLRSPA